MYDQSMGTYALAEAYMVTKDERLKEPLQKAVNWLVSNQIPGTGGWRYEPVPDPRNKGGDMSISGWVISALVSAKNAGAHVPPKVFEDAGKFVLKHHLGSGKFAYHGDDVKLTMSAVGMFCLQLLGQKVMGPIVAGANLNTEGGSGQENSNDIYKKIVGETLSTLVQNPPDAENPGTEWPYYYWYYGTFAMRIHGGESWTKWKKQTHDVLLPTQAGDGSWLAPKPEAGKIVTTAWVLLILSAPERNSLNPSPSKPTRPPKPPTKTFGGNTRRPTPGRPNGVHSANEVGGSAGVGLPDSDPFMMVDPLQDPTELHLPGADQLMEGIPLDPTTELQLPDEDPFTEEPPVGEPRELQLPANDPFMPGSVVP